MEIIWHAKALKQLEDAMEYCMLQFGAKIAERVANKIDKDILLLSQNPEMGQIEETLKGRSSCFRYIVEGPLKFIYTVEDGYIFIHLLWDCPQNPSRLINYLD